MNAGKIIGKIIGTIMGIMVFVILPPIIILVGPAYIIIVGIKAFARSVKNQLPDARMKNYITLDRRRCLRFTPKSIKMAEEALGMSISEISDRIAKAAPSTERVSTALWLLLIDEDPTLTVQAVTQILFKYLNGGWHCWRSWRLRQAYRKYVQAWNDFNREFGGIK